MKNKKHFKLILILVAILLSYINYQKGINENLSKGETNTSYQIENVPEYEGNDYVIINNNEPLFSESEITTDSYELYGKLDYLGRATSTFANIGPDSMPTKERESIGMIKPSGWHTVKYDIVSGKYLYNRCHLIGYQLTGENANINNLITCTIQMNTGAMLDFENQVANYIRETKNHVLYRAIPIYEDDNLLAKGVNIQALSIEDHGKGIKFNVFIYNVQKGIKINYKTGESSLIE